MGEIDFIVMNRAGDLLLIEQKTGSLIESSGDLLKAYAPDRAAKSVTTQILRNQDGLLNKYRKAHQDLLKTTNALYCPDYKIIEAKTAALDRSQIIDSTEVNLLCQKVMKLLPEGVIDPKSKQVERFLKNELLIQEDLVRISSTQGTYTTRLASGLNTWVSRLSLEPYRLRIQGTAGSGKTQLAIHELKRATDQQLRALYLSFNRPLAQHMAELMPKQVKVTSLYSFCEELVRAEDAELASKRGFLTDNVDDLFELAAAIEPTVENQFDVVIVDEGQDFTQAQADFLIQWAKPNGKVMWLEDPIQNIYMKPGVILPQWPVLRAPVNFRNPRPIAEFLARMADKVAPGSGEELTCANPFDGTPIDYYAYERASPTDLKRATEAAIASLLSKGFLGLHITVLSYKGQSKSEILKLEMLNGFKLRKPVLNKTDQYTSGELETDTLFRYKGLSNLAIVLTEVEFDEWKERAARLLFVGASRAKIALCIVHDTVAGKAIRQ